LKKAKTGKKKEEEKKRRVAKKSEFTRVKEKIKQAN